MALPTTARSWLWSVLTTFGRLMALLAWLFPRRLKPTFSRESMHPTSYLDALRGYAALIVYHTHIFRGEWMPLGRPWLVILFRGTAQIYTFYVISGFALSYSALGRMHKQQCAQDSLASSVFRRYFRLFLPTAFATFVAMMVIATGLGKWESAGPDPTQPTIWGNVWFWVGDTINLINPFAELSPLWHPGVHGSAYLVQIWTLMIEFRGSMIVYLFLMGVSKAKPWVRTGALFAGVAMACWWRTPYVALFLAGTWLADLRQWRAHLRQHRGGDVQLPMSTTQIDPTIPGGRPYSNVVIQEDEEKQSFESTAASSSAQNESEPLYRQERLQSTVPLLQAEEPVPRRLSPASWRLSAEKLWNPRYELLRELPYFVLFILAIYLLSGPMVIDKNTYFPFNYIVASAPPSWNNDLVRSWPWVLSSILIVFALDHSPTLRKPLTLPFSQWLGELSFGLYTMHNTVRYALWDKYLIPWQGAYFGDHAYEPRSFIASYIVLTIAVLWAAESFRWVDVKCVRFSKFLADKAFR